MPNPNNPQYLNRYVYVFNNPLRYTDPTGQCSECGAPDSDFFGPPLPESDITVLDTFYVQDTRIYLDSHSSYSDPFSFNDGGSNIPFVDSSFLSENFFGDFFSSLSPELVLGFYLVQRL